MKKSVVSILIAAMFVVTLGCTNSSDSGDNKDLIVNPSADSEIESEIESEVDQDVRPSDDEFSEDKSSIEVDKGILNVEITLPASMFEGQDIDETIEEAKKDGIKEAVKHDDGSVTYKMSRSKHNEMMK